MGIADFLRISLGSREVLEAAFRTRFSFLLHDPYYPQRKQCLRARNFRTVSATVAISCLCACCGDVCHTNVEACTSKGDRNSVQFALQSGISLGHMRLSSTRSAPAGADCDSFLILQRITKDNPEIDTEFFGGYMAHLIFRDQVRDRMQQGIPPESAEEYLLRVR